MTFYLTTLNLVGCSTEEAPIVAKNETDSQKVIARDHWNNADYLCKNYILNALEDSLYSVYNDMKSAKELWESLDRKYKIEGVGSKKFIIDRFLDFIMLDMKSVTIQFQELQVLINEIKAEGMLLSEAFLVAAVIYKLPETWKEFKSYLMLKNKKMTLEALFFKLNVEEENRARNKCAKTSYMAKANIMEHGQSSKMKKSKDKWSSNQKGKGVKLGLKGAIAKKPTEKFQDDINLSAMVFEVNMVGSNLQEWWIDTRATRHVCYDRRMFIAFEPAVNGEKVFMENLATSVVAGIGKVVLKMTLGKS
ncbi:uncharacterized protein LOC130780663 [Actinidia eriantha]|uniref:uncharacterized protein LOC130780663 n=1 Tax=Actinidia eriantha TaxID=165200 RepID=UPI002590DB4F|nr:uncharacterized protein LOC130780663 [Actinidia eriantha]